MTVLAAMNPAVVPATGMTLLEGHADFVAGLDCHDQAKRLRRNGAEALLRRHPDLTRWMERPTVDRIAEARRLYAWPFLSWCFAVGVLRPDVELLIARSKGAHYITWARMHPDQVGRVAQTAQAMGWVTEWVDRVSTALADGLHDLQAMTEIIWTTAVVRADINAAVAVLPRCRASQRGLLHSLHTVCYQLGVVNSPPEHGNARHTTIEQRMAPLPQPVIRNAFVRYLRTVATTVRPKTVESRAASLSLFGGWLGRHHPGITTLSQLRRHHLEEFLAYDAGRPCQGKVAGSGRTISVSHHARAVRDLRALRRHHHLGLGRPATRPGAASRRHSPASRPAAPSLAARRRPSVHARRRATRRPAARAGIVLLRGTGLRLGELLDLELDCLWDLSELAPG